jgi:hypothetical protein
MADLAGSADAARSWLQADDGSGEMDVSYVECSARVGGDADAANAVALDAAIARTRRTLYVGVVDGEAALSCDGGGGGGSCCSSSGGSAGSAAEARMAAGVLRVYEAAFDVQVRVFVGAIALLPCLRTPAARRRGAGVWAWR